MSDAQYEALAAAQDDDDRAYHEAVRARRRREVFDAIEEDREHPEDRVPRPPRRDASEA